MSIDSSASAKELKPKFIFKYPGILKLELSTSYKPNIRLPCSLVVTNNTSHSIIVLFSFIPLTDLTAFKQSRNISIIPAGDTGKFSTNFGHNFGYVKLYPGARNPSSPFNTEPPNYLGRTTIVSKKTNIEIN